MLLEFIKNILLNDMSYLRSTPDKALLALKKLKSKKILIVEKNVDLKKQINISFGKYVGFLGNYY